MPKEKLICTHCNKPTTLKVNLLKSKKGFVCSKCNEELKPFCCPYCTELLGRTRYGLYCRNCGISIADSSIESQLIPVLNAAAKKKEK